MATKRENFVAIVEFLESNGAATELVETIENEIAIGDRKAKKAAERAAAKKQAGDELRETVLNVLTSDLQGIDEIVEAIGDEEVTPGKVRARLTQLVDLGEVVKEMVKVEGTPDENGKAKSKKITMYARA